MVHLCQWLIFFKYRVHKFGNEQTNERMDERICWKHYMSPPASLAWYRSKAQKVGYIGYEVYTVSENGTHTINMI